MTGAEYSRPRCSQQLWDGARRGVSIRARRVEGVGADLPLAQEPRRGIWSAASTSTSPRTDKDDEAPFAFLATYTTRLSAHAKAQHLPLGQALREYAGAANKARLLSLLLPVQRAAEQCAWLKAMVDAGEIYHPLRWTPAEAFQLLTDLPRLEAAGIVVRVPGTWRANRPPRPQVSATVGGKPPSGLGTDALLDFQMGVRLDGEPLTAAEIRAAARRARTGCISSADAGSKSIARSSRGCSTSFGRSSRRQRRDGLSFAEAMRLLAGAHVPGDRAAGRRARLVARRRRSVAGGRRSPAFASRGDWRESSPATR